MALTTYAELQAAIASWLARDDLTAYIPDFITLFEAAACRRLKVRLQETSTTLTPTSGVATLPGDYLGHRRVTWTGSPERELTYVAPPIFKTMWPDNSAGNPAIYTIEGTSLKVKPLDDTGLDFDYYQKTAAVSGTLNWLYTNHYDVYLFGSLAEANAFNKDIDPAGLWKARRDEGFGEIQTLNFNEGAGMAVQVFGATP